MPKVLALGIEAEGAQRVLGNRECSERERALPPRRVYRRPFLRFTMSLRRA